MISTQIFLLVLPINILLTLMMIQIKHLLIDFVWQPPFEWQNKGTYGHIGGIAHAGKNAIGTGLAFALGFWWNLPLPVLAAVVLADFVIHYHVDWMKMNANDYCGLCPENAKFWWLLGLDQAMHQITYLILMVGVILWKLS
jgi:hypothetical protein